MSKPMEGMGAIVTRDGVGFRVWAPHAEAVSVVGSFNGWDEAAAPLAVDGNGYWYGFVAAASVGQEYKFVLRNGEQRLERVDPYAAQVTNSVGNGVIYDHAAFDWAGDDFTAPSFNELVIYELHAGTFAATKDGEVADLADLAGRLEHLVALGVNALQLMPVAEFAGDVSWGYNPAHIFAVESAYGGPDALKSLVKAAHAVGLAVIQDVVYNHFGPSDLNLWQFDGWSENGKGGSYFFNDWRSATPWGDTRPDYGRGEVRQFIRDNAMSWLENYHLDGLRYDMTPYMRSVDAGETNIPEGWSLCHWINSEVRAKYPHKILIAEDLHSNPAVSSTGPEGAAFHAQWDAQFVHPVRRAVVAADDAYRSTAEVARAITYSYGDAFSRVIYTESHDEVANGKARVPQEIDAGDPTGYFAQKRSTVGAGLVLTSPGIPMLFQGQEFLEGGWFRDTVALEWDQDESFHGIVKLYRDLIRLRLNRDGRSAGLTGGGVRVFHNNDDANLLAFQRWRDHGIGDDVVVVANLTNTARGMYRIGFPAPGKWQLLLNSDALVYSDAFSDHPSADVVASQDDYDGLQASAEITIGPYSLLIYGWQG
ncbi:MAG: alpha amylase C-terminal domain-containing protein [Propionicimonas sp.]|uniref:alpha-amylase family glycosyl hydrolase n=1 Tax=Propionicimonas sp. TaxID=1955623 RepID=UPI0025DDDB5B|nr:alpha-amylase family glycosyl hydrolase [Propionicimonas sp.]MCG2806462.1 alpha amylase C-terminal domain-containing protein [Propionicimonas sp.]